MVDAKNPTKTRKTISTTEVFPLCLPFLSAKKSSSLEQGGVCLLFPRISGNHTNHGNDENHGNPRCKPQVPQTTGVETSKALFPKAFWSLNLALKHDYKAQFGCPRIFCYFPLLSRGVQILFFRLSDPTEIPPPITIHLSHDPCAVFSVVSQTLAATPLLLSVKMAYRNPRQALERGHCRKKFTSEAYRDMGLSRYGGIVSHEIVLPMALWDTKQLALLFLSRAALEAASSPPSEPFRKIFKDLC